MSDVGPRSGSQASFLRSLEMRRPRAATSRFPGFQGQDKTDRLRDIRRSPRQPTDADTALLTLGGKVGGTETGPKTHKPTFDSGDNVSPCGIPLVAEQD